MTHEGSALNKEVTGVPGLGVYGVKSTTVRMSGLASLGKGPVGFKVRLSGNSSPASPVACVDLITYGLFIWLDAMHNWTLSWTLSGSTWRRTTLPDLLVTPGEAVVV